MHAEHRDSARHKITSRKRDGPWRPIPPEILHPRATAPKDAAERSWLDALLAHVADQVRYAVRVAPLVIVPAHHFDHIVDGKA